MIITTIHVHVHQLNAPHKSQARAFLMIVLQKFYAHIKLIIKIFLYTCTCTYYSITYMDILYIHVHYTENSQIVLDTVTCRSFHVKSTHTKN